MKMHHALPAPPGRGSYAASARPAPLLASLFVSALLIVSPPLGISPMPMPASAAEIAPAAASAAAMSKSQVETLLRKIPALAIVNADDQPFFTSTEGRTNVGYFFLEPTDALRELRQLQQADPRSPTAEPKPACRSSTLALTAFTHNVSPRRPARPTRASAFSLSPRSTSHSCAPSRETSAESSGYGPRGGRWRAI